MVFKKLDPKVKIRIIKTDGQRVKAQDTVMEIEVDDEYLRASISYGKLAHLMWQQRKYVELKRTLCHECVHILLNKLKGSNEPVVEHISRLFYKLL